MQYVLGDLLIDTGRQSVSRAGSIIPLPKLSFDLLLVLVKAAPNPVSLDDLMREVWPGLFVSLETVTKRVTLLRDALNEDARAPRYIASLRGRGYQIIANVSVRSEADELRTELALREGAAPPVARAQFGRYTAFAILAAVLAAAAASGWNYWAGRGGSSPPARQPASPPAHSIAVLPFLDMSEAKDQEYFADGMTESVIDLLAKVPDLRVPARTSSFYFKGKTIKVADIARELNVENVLEGSVRKSGSRLRITAQLIRAGDGYHLWSETYDRNLDDVFDIEDQIAAKVVGTLQVHLLGSAFTHRRPTQNPEAYALLLQGRFFGRRNDQADRQISIDLYKRAIDIDPMYALAWAWLSTGYNVQALSGWVPAATGYAQAREAALRAIELDPELGDGHGALGHVLEACDWNWAGANAEYQRALTLDPGSVRILNLNGHLAMDEGRIEDAARFYRKAHATDPLSPSANSGLAYALWVSGHLSEAQAAYQESVALAQQSDFPAWLGLLMVERGDAAGLPEIQRDHDESARLVSLAAANHRLARKADSDRALAELIKKYPVFPYKIAHALAYRGDADQAFGWLERAYTAHDNGLTWIKVDVGFRELRNDPRYAAILRRMNLPP